MSLKKLNSDGLQPEKDNGSLISLTECVICLEVPNIRGKLKSCDHVFCFECIKTWSEQENTCPLCKQRFGQISKHRMIDDEVKSKPDGKRKRKPKKVESIKVSRRNQCQDDDSDSFSEFMSHHIQMMGNLEALLSAPRPHFANGTTSARSRILAELLQRNRERAAQIRQAHPLLRTVREPNGLGSASNPEVIDDSDDEVQIVEPSTSSSSSTQNRSNTLSSSITAMPSPFIEGLEGLLRYNNSLDDEDDDNEDDSDAENSLDALIARQVLRARG